MSSDHISNPTGVTGRGGAPEPGHPTLTFPDLPRLELDQLLGQLVERAQEVLATQSRLRGLLRATQLVVGDLALPAALRRIVEAARELLDARYAALGVVSPSGGLAEFVHSGMTPEDVERIGDLPEGKGLLGVLIEDPSPIRLRRMTDDQRSAGFPPGHPPMASFLGVPIRIRDEVYGNLYLAESSHGEFSAEDEELAAALAATAAVAVENARLYASARSRGEWLQASAAITRELLAPVPADGSAPLRLIAEHCRGVADADLVTIVRPGPREPGGLVVEVAVGSGADQLAGTDVSSTESLSGQVYHRDEPLRSSDLHRLGGPAARVGGALDAGPVLAVPMRGSSRVHGVLWMARARGRAAFTADEAEMATGFATQAAVAIELAAARAQQERTAMLDDRDRIAADLHEHVIQRLFAAGLALQSAAAQLGGGRPAQQVLSAVAELDDTITRIRASVFAPREPPTEG